MSTREAPMPSPGRKQTREWEGFVGATFPGLYAMIAQDYMHKYNMTESQLGAGSVEDHFNGARKPDRPVRRRSHLIPPAGNRPCRDSLRLFTAPPSLTVRQQSLSPRSSGQGVHRHADQSPRNGPGKRLHCPPRQARHRRPLDATVAAGQRAFKMAKADPQDINMVEVHDCFSIAEICADRRPRVLQKAPAGKFTATGETGARRQPYRSTRAAGSSPAATGRCKPVSSRV